MKKHRNSQKRIKFQDACYFVTVKTFNNFPYFRERIFCDLFVESLKLWKELKGFLLFGWVVIYDHVHLLFQPSDNFDISKVMFSVKKQFSHNVNRVMSYNKTDIYPEGAQALARLREKWDIKILNIRHFIQQLYKFDMFVQISKIRFRIKYKNNNPYPKFKWQKSFHDHYIRNDQDFNGKMKYIAYNPEKHGLPADWQYVYTNPKYENLIDESRI